MQTVDRLFGLVTALFSALLFGCTTTPAEQAEPQRPKIVIVTMFERGADSGDAPGEFQLWNERRKLTRVFSFHGHHDLHMDESGDLLAIVTGVGTAKAAASVMALGMDPRFDLSQSYWLIAGISGFDPNDASLGSAAWAEYLVDGDLAHEIDAREKPADWQWGYIARHTKVPFDPNKPEPRGEVFRLNPALVQWAYELTRDMTLPDSTALAASRSRYTNYPNARKPPFVLRGDHLAALTFWHGEILNGWANAWVDYWSDGNGEFVSSAMEDTGSFQSLTYLNRLGRANKDRVLVLRTASNYTVPPPGVGAAENLLSENDGYSGLGAALESAYRVGSVVIDTLLADWPRYRDTTPEPAMSTSAHLSHEHVYHLIQAKHWQQAVATGDMYFPPTFEQDGFTHATANPEMLLPVANHFYTDVPGDWLCLKMTVRSLSNAGVDVVFEGTAPVGDKAANFEGSDAELFPHILGGIPPAAVLDVLEVSRDDSGRFLAIDDL
ncbi:MAG: DUF952 domain-containing protein [Pseudomonadota bacterium]